MLSFRDQLPKHAIVVDGNLQIKMRRESTVGALASTLCSTAKREDERGGESDHEEESEDPDPEERGGE